MPWSRPARYPLAPAHEVTHAEAFLTALHEHLSPTVALHVLGDSAGGTLALELAQSHARKGAIAVLTLIAPWLDPGSPGRGCGPSRRAGSPAASSPST